MPRLLITPPIRRKVLPKDSVPWLDPKSTPLLLALTFHKVTPPLALPLLLQVRKLGTSALDIVRGVDPDHEGAHTTPPRGWSVPVVVV